jgi:geranylgeranyl pyrophosphate synthase
MEGDFREYIDSQRDKINQVLRNFYKTTIISEEETSLRKFLRDSEDFILQGGRRLHPITMIETFQGLAPEKMLLDFKEDIYDVCIAPELMHISSLMIDDLVDDEKRRRGKKTFHLYISEQGEGDSAQLEAYQKASAIYGGNLTALFGSRIITNSNFDDKKKAQALEFYLNGLSGVTRGHLLDEYYKYQVPLNQITLENYLILTEKRSKQMETAVGLGAIFGNARKSQINPLIKAMNRIGIIEQMKNDYFGSFGDPALQSIDSDITSGQATVLNVLAYQQGNKEQKKVLSSTLGNLNATPDQIDNIRIIYKDTGAIEFIKMYANSLKNDIFNLMHSIYPGLRKSAMDYFLELLQYLTDFGNN